MGSLKSVLKAKTSASLKQSHTELWVSLESRGNHEIKMASRCCECGMLVKPPFKQLGIFHFRTKYSLKSMNVEFRKGKEEKGSPIKLHILFYFNFVFHIIHIATFRSSVS